MYEEWWKAPRDSGLAKFSPMFFFLAVASRMLLRLIELAWVRDAHWGLSICVRSIRHWGSLIFTLFVSWSCEWQPIYSSLMSFVGVLYKGKEINLDLDNNGLGYLRAYKYLFIDVKYITCHQMGAIGKKL